jgi:hypothetical protein
MPEKKNAFPAAGTDGEGLQKELSDNLHSGSQNVKPGLAEKSQEDLDREYLINTYTRFQLQRVAQNRVLERFPLLKNKDYTKCHRVPFASFVDLVRNSETRRAYYNGVVTCANPLLCPVCAPRIMGIRSAEIKRAVHAWLNENPKNTCYMLTFTASHTAQDRLADFLPAFKKAVESFWKNGTINRLLTQSGRAGRITSFEFQVSQYNGWHPHQHILLFCRETDFSVVDLSQFWINALRASGLDGLNDIAFDLVEARSAENYLTKISSEMALGNVKEGRGAGHFSPMQLIHEMASGDAWAAERFIELFLASQGLHSLYWSRGLKARFGIGEHSDQEITEGRAQSDLTKFIDIYKEGYRALSVTERALLRSYAAFDDYDRAFALLEKRGAQYLKPGESYEA